MEEKGSLVYLKETVAARVGATVGFGIGKTRVAHRALESRKASPEKKEKGETLPRPG